MNINTQWTQQHYNATVIKAYLLASDQQIGSEKTNQILQYFGIPRSYFEATSNWVSIDFFNQFIDRFNQYGNELKLQKDAGYLCLSKEILGVNDYLLKHFISPVIAFKAMEYYLTKFNKVRKFKIVDFGKNFVVIRLTQDGLHQLPIHKSTNDHWIAVLDAHCLLFNLNTSIKTLKSSYRGDEYCEYFVQWNEIDQFNIFKYAALAVFVTSFISVITYLIRSNNINDLVTTIYILLISGFGISAFYLFQYIKKYNHVVRAFENYEKQVDLKYQELQNAKNIIQENEKSLLKANLEQQFNDIAKKTAHDIRSPLTTINYIAKKMAQSNPKDGQSLMLMSKQLINIANDLLNYQQTGKDHLSGVDSGFINSNTQLLTDPNSQSSLQNINDHYLQRFQMNTQTATKAKKHTVHPQLPQITTADLVKMVIESVDLKKIELNNEAVRITVYNDLERGGLVQFDETQLRRILSNILNNAVEAIKVVPAVITISIANHALDNADYIAIEVRDNGAGFPIEVINQFGKKAISHGKTNGHGIGLSIAHEMVQQWNGCIQIANIKPSGAKVGIYLPHIHY